MIVDQTKGVDNMIFYAKFDSGVILRWDYKTTFTRVNRAFKFFSNNEGHGVLYTGKGKMIRESGVLK